VPILLSVVFMAVLGLFFLSRRSRKRRQLYFKGALHKAFERHRPKAWMDEGL